MKLKFDPNQQYQTDAINSIVSIFEGQPIDSDEFKSAIRIPGELLHDDIVRNILVIDKETIKQNIIKIQDANEIDNNLVEEADVWNFSIEMETGTGKTYVYLKTIFELNKKYGFKKFIIVVPSVAIREGVLKNLEITEEHFKSLYSNTTYNYFVYNSKRVNVLRSFARDNTIQIMVINKDAFSKDSNIINRDENEKSGDIALINYVKATNPIVIIDEPQSLGPAGEEAVKNLQPLSCLRFSATHKDLYNLIYKLDPIKAYQMKLVKKIELASSLSGEDHNSAYVRLLEATNKKGKITAQVEINVNTGNGPDRKKINVKYGDDLFHKSNDREEYRNNFIVSQIDVEEGRENIKFSSGRKLKLNQAIGGFDDEIKKVQIKNTIREHLEKTRKLKPLGIKVLSLFFIDRVVNYRAYDEKGNPAKGKYALWFEEAYNELIKESSFKDLLPHTADQVHNGYFSTDKKKGQFKDSSEKGTKDDEDTYSLIMKDKEKLLSQEEPLSFIFSHSALREGWDNPNVFQICTLNETDSNMKKRQEIGRGLRLPVNQQGVRIYDENINRLTVVANESYEDFVRKLQEDMKADGIEFGIIKKIAFSKINQVVDGKDVPLGKDVSTKIWEQLKAKGHLDDEGNVQKSFNPKAEDFELGLGAEFNKEIQERVIDIVEGNKITNHIVDKKNRKPVRLNKQVMLTDDFKELWRQISQRTRYSVEYLSVDLIKASGKAMKAMEGIRPPRIITRRDRLDINNQGITGEMSAQFDEEVPFTGSLPDILGYLQRETELTRSTLVKILIESNRLEDFKINPSRFMELASSCIKNELHSLMVNGIKYEKIDGESWDMSLFEKDDEKEITRYLNNLLEVKNKEKTIHDFVEYDSDIEREFAKKLDERDDIKLFLKLPHWFLIETPIGDYRPDWAIVKKIEGKDDRLYFVRETKGTTDIKNLRGTEAEKIHCGKAHFKEIKVDYEVVTNVEQI